MSALAEEAVAAETRRTLCPRCEEIVLAAPLLGGLMILVEVGEFLPLWRCPICLSGRQRDPRTRFRRRGGDYEPEASYFTRDQPCWRCGREAGEDPALTGSRRPGSPGPGWVGEPLSGYGVALGEDGRARPLDLSSVLHERHKDGSVKVIDPRFEGAAIHRAHLCLGSVRASS